jgi:hypothetical protein
VHQTQPGIGNRPPGCHRRRITIQRNQPSARAEARQNFLAMPATPKGGIDVNPHWPHLQTVHCFLQQNGLV